MKNGLFISFLFVVLFFFNSNLAIAASHTIDDPKSCAAFGGQWASNAELPPQIGRCVLPEPLVVNSGDQVFIGPGVVLVLNAATNQLSGNLYVSNTAVLRILAGTRNTGVIDIEDNAELQLWGGWLDNAGLVQTEGLVEIFPNIVLYNTGTLRNFGGGEINNDGRILMYQVRGNCTIINEPGNDIINRKEVYVIAPCVLTNQGFLDNQSMATMVVNGYLSNENGGDLRNRGWLDVSSGELRNDGSTLENRGSGKLWAYGSGKIVNSGAAMLSNRDTARIQISAPSVLNNQNMAQIQNHANTEILIDDGTINNSATFVNYGNIKNDTTNNNTRGEFNNHSGGYLDNKAGANVFNTFGIFNNNSGATVNNSGEFWTCFGWYQGAGTFMGNAINSCVPRPNFPTPPRLP